MEIRKLNALRGLAALIVAISHFSIQTNWLNGYLGGRGGHLGVMIFFMLSGFLMSYLYMDKSFTADNIRNYAVARIARVVPLFVIVVLVSYLLQRYWMAGIMYNIASKEILASHLLLLKGINVLWTIPPEIQFYVVFVLMWWVFSKYKGHLFLLIAISVPILFFTGPRRFLGTVWDLSYDFFLLRSLPYFFIGVVFGRLYRRWAAPKYLQHQLFGLALFAIFPLYPEIFNLLSGQPHQLWVDMELFSAMSVIFFIVVFLVPDQSRFLANPCGDFLGKISYSLYLLHNPILWQVKKYDLGNRDFQLFTFIACSLLISYISYRLLELPAAKMIRKLQRTRP